MSAARNAGELVEALSRAGVLSPIDRHLAIAVAELAPGCGSRVSLAAALASRAVQQGHVCVDLRERGGRPHASEEELDGVTWPELDSWLKELRASPVVSDGSRTLPLVLTADGLLYLQRYHHLERRLEGWIRQRVGGLELDRDSVREVFRARSSASSELEAQGLAALVALTRRVLFVSGGPGTGKTTTVARMLLTLAAHRERTLGDGARGLQVSLLGPTGKATQRLESSLAGGLDRLGIEPGLRANIHCQAATIHRALGFRPASPTRFRHDADLPLSADVVVVDEASMVDLALMTRLLEAVPTTARLVMLGDEHQLASVEAGSIFGDLCSGARRVRRSVDQLELIRDVAGVELAEDARDPPGARAAASVVESDLRDGIVQLTRNYRYAADSGIGTMARLIRRGDADSLLEHLEAGSTGVAFHRLSEEPARARSELSRLIVELSRDGYAGYLSARGAEDKLSRLDGFRILAAHRTGSFGVGELNATVERALTRDGLRPERSAYDQQPILVTRNDPQTGLYNGDVGLVLGNGSSARAHFRSEAGIVDFSVARVPPFETVFAMTVHKSQGSEFDRVVVVLPPPTSPLASRELIYSGVTRARRDVHLIGSRKSVLAAVTQRTRRISGLPRALWSLD